MSEQRHDNSEELIAVRTHLTVALLSLELLQRRHPLPEDAMRLCSFTTEALSRIKDELARLDAVLAKHEDHAGRRADSLRAPYRRATPNAGGEQRD